MQAQHPASAHSSGQQCQGTCTLTCTGTAGHRQCRSDKGASSQHLHAKGSTCVFSKTQHCSSVSHARWSCVLQPQWHSLKSPQMQSKALLKAPVSEVTYRAGKELKPRQYMKEMRAGQCCCRQDLHAPLGMPLLCTTMGREARHSCADFWQPLCTTGKSLHAKMEQAAPAELKSIMAVMRLLSVPHL